MEMPKFNFSDDLGLTEADLENKTNSDRKPPKIFKPGNYQLKIVHAEYTGPANNDPTWYKVRLELGGIDTRTIRETILVPTTKLTYNEEGSKSPQFLFIKFRQFLRALGEDAPVNKSALNKVVPKYFANLKSLVGKVVDLDIGYSGHHINYEGSSYVIVNNKGELFKDDTGEIPTFPNRDAAMAEAASYGFEIQAFPRVLKFNPKANAEENNNGNDESWD